MKRATHFWNQNKKENILTNFLNKPKLTQNVLSPQTLWHFTNYERARRRSHLIYLKETTSAHTLTTWGSSKPIGYPQSPPIIKSYPYLDQKLQTTTSKVRSALPSFLITKPKLNTYEIYSKKRNIKIIGAIILLTEVIKPRKK